MSVLLTLPAFLTIGVALVVLPDKAGMLIKTSVANINHLCIALGLIVAALSVPGGMIKKPYGVWTS